jgi:hypothetical protein
MASYLLDVRQVRLAMRKGDVRLVVIAQRSCPADKRSKTFIRQRFVDGTHAIGALGMKIARVVVQEGWMRYEGRCHLAQRSPAMLPKAHLR